MDHNYVLTGLLFCPHCQVFLEGGSSKKQKYHYYRHPKKTKKDGCELGSIRAEAIEELVIGQLQVLGSDEELMDDVVRLANEASLAQVSELEQKLSLLISQRDEIGSKADALIERMTELPVELVQELVGKKLEGLVEQKAQLSQEITNVEDEIAEARISALNAQDLQQALKNFGTVFGALKLHEQQELLELVVDGIELTSSEMKISLLGNTQKAYFEKVGSEYRVVSDLLWWRDSNPRPSG